MKLSEIHREPHREHYRPKSPLKEHLANDVGTTFGDIRLYRHVEQKQYFFAKLKSLSAEQYLQQTHGQLDDFSELTRNWRRFIWLLLNLMFEFIFVWY